MGTEPDPERLRALEEWLARVNGQKDRKPRGETGKAFSQGEMAWRMVIELVSGMLLGLAIGYGLDHVFGTRPVFLVIFALLGFAAGVRTMLGTARQMTANQKATTQAADPARTEGK
ncbi:AtpZ/AtpI family protein [Aliigemmobacter aestuarii]|uniref:ATP synthase protein I n=1 Tax=Aliigemmobacter aestuarii TaxID=1445661 RepID=A0A4S3MRV7_9RHOB|nr:AtpZ/AtpI family protein [Gemmobacter aestuarii]THD85167.1 AtpZ/AtpI family protein [Gemmobacter aestuarii]